jgi:nucleoporin POM152
LIAPFAEFDVVDLERATRAAAAAASSFAVQRTPAAHLDDNTIETPPTRHAMSRSSPIGAFPQTPVAASRRGAARAPASSSKRTSTSNGTGTGVNSLPVAPQQGASTSNSAPVIPLHILDAPTQRLYAFGFYAALLAWKFYDWAQLVEEDTESFWLFLKWIAIDCAFLFGLPELRIPWLELSQPFVVAAFFSHALFDWLLMFNIGVWTPTTPLAFSGSCC